MLCIGPRSPNWPTSNPNWYSKSSTLFSGLPTIKFCYYYIRIYLGLTCNRRPLRMIELCLTIKYKYYIMLCYKQSINIYLIDDNKTFLSRNKIQEGDKRIGEVLEWYEEVNSQTLNYVTFSIHDSDISDFYRWTFLLADLSSILIGWAPSLLGIHLSRASKCWNIFIVLLLCHKQPAQGTQSLLLGTWEKIGGYFHWFFMA